ncbi:Elongation factor 1-gamma [Entomophthora muscae]|uniref:Elongation factor 1-gamma n=1 Tax=Entomophthora muscae TaxID=34485 RepID=A0ACC2S9F1_9FUNG|nr:Elongation factor 1-gamma [Entomophthora muscae]
MSAGRLYGSKGNPRVQKVQITAKLSSIEIDFDENFEMGKHNKTPEYLAKFPLGQVPAFEAKDGLCLTESAGLAFYVANLKENNPLLGKNKHELGKIYQYSFFAETQLSPQAATIVYPAFGYMPYNEETEKLGYQKLEGTLAYLNKEVEGKKYLVGDSITLADIMIGSNLEMLYAYVLVEEHRNKHPHLTNYFKHYRQMTEVTDASGPMRLADKPLKVEAKK